MARISLRAYNRDIEAMIDRDQIEEAIAHSRYILQFYPKHVDTYRLMGKALLEAHRFSDASDIFHRVLSSVPDDFIAHLGMSIIREDENNLDAAIWHMERSFEVQPSNAAVQVELRRLYGLRDGVSPQKIQLTRGALARMSAKSNLFSQAISELRAALSDDPQRPDLQVVLAEMYFNSGSRMAAIETCNSLVSKLPYCLVANQLLAEILPDTERAERAQEFKERLIELDPYYAHLSPVAPTVDQISDGAVTIERHDYPGESLAAPASEQPEWATTLGVKLEDDSSPEEETPEWLLPDAEDTGPSPEDEGMDDIVEAEVEDDTSEAIFIEEDVNQPDREETPEWLKLEEEEPSIQPETEKLEESLQSEEDMGEGEVSDVEPVAPLEAEQLPDWMSEAEGISEAETPDWLREAMEGEEEDPGMGMAAAAGAIAGLTGDEQEEIASTSDEMKPGEEKIPSSMESEQEAPPEIEPVEEAEISAEEMEEDTGITHEEIIASDTATTTGITAAAAASGAALGDSLDQDEGEDQEIEPEVAPPSDESALETEIAEFQPDEQDAPLPEDEAEVPDWLQDLGEGIPEEPSPEPISEQLESEDEAFESIEKVSELEEVAGEDLIEEPEVLPPADETPFEVEYDASPFPVSGISAEEFEEEFPETLPDWLTAVSPEEVPDAVDLKISGTEEQIDIVHAEIPDWLRRMEQEHRAEMLAAAEEREILEALDYEADFTDLTGADVPAWLVSAMETEPTSEYEGTEFLEAMPEIAVDEDELLEERVEAEEPKEMLVSEADLEEAVTPELAEDMPLEEELVPEEIEVEEPLEAAVVEGEPLLEELEVEQPDGMLVSEADLEEAVSPELEEAIPLEEELVAEEIEVEEPIEEAEVVEAETIHEELEAEEPEEMLVSEVDLEEAAAPELEEQFPLEEELIPEAIEGEESLEAVEAEEWIEGDTQPIFVAEPVEPSQIEDEGQPLSVEVEETPIEAPITGEDEDAAMAWLESLAAKQGVAEEELLTAPEDRVEEPPEWIIESLTEGEEEPEEEPASKIDEIAAAAAAGAAVSALIGEKDQEGEIPVEEEAALVDETSEWIPETTPEIEEISQVEETEQEILTEVEAEIEPETIETQEPPAEEIPAWLSGLDEEEEAVIETQPPEWSPDMLAEEEPGVEEPVEAEIQVKYDLNAASLAQLERIPGIGFIHAQRIVNYRMSSGPFQDLDELEEVPGLTQDMVEDLKNYLYIEVVVEEAPPISSIPELQEAWKSITEGQIDIAIDQYTQFIKSDQHLDEVIRDLQEALVKYPADASLYQSLGDAYLRVNMLQEALDAYNRAEDLIK
jgi:competence ComEA-like helix-hairpin-helix protein